MDAGPHPNHAHARWGRRLLRLDPDPATAPRVKCIFAERLFGRSAASIARELNECQAPCPAQADPGRNRHRRGHDWSLRTVIEILRNPRYTGREVWNRVGDRDGRRPAETRGEWAIAERPLHPALVSERDFVIAQAVRVTRAAADGTVRTYRLSGLLMCGWCGRRMDSHWVNDRPGYRCRHGHTSAQSRSDTGPKNLYLREHELLARIGAHLGTDTHNIDVAAYVRAGSCVRNPNPHSGVPR